MELENRWNPPFVQPLGKPWDWTRDYSRIEGIYYPQQRMGINPQQQLWNQLGQGYYGSDALESQTPKVLRSLGYGQAVGQIGGLWRRFPTSQHVGTILELGCGYGRASINLSLGWQLSCDRYVGLDISVPLLRRLQYLKQVFDFYPGAEFTLICDSADHLPVPDDSVDLIVSNAVLMHIEKPKVEQILAQMARVLKPGGAFILNNSFHNQACPAHRFRNALRTFQPEGKRDIYTQHYLQAEIEQMLAASGIAAKSGAYRIEPNPPYLLVPNQVGRFRLKLADWVNKRLHPSESQKIHLADSFNAYSVNALAI